MKNTDHVWYPLSLGNMKESGMFSHRFITSWSGGKDSCYALHCAKNAGHQPVALLSMLENGGRHSRSHGLSTSLLAAQAQRLQLPWLHSRPNWDNYETEFVTQLIMARDTLEIDAVVFGDIDLQGHRDWIENVCQRKDVQLTPLFPLWGKKRRSVVDELIDKGIKAMIVSCNDALGELFLGRILEKETISDLEKAGIDVCGENGEYHTVIINSPDFTHPIKVSAGQNIAQSIERKTRPTETYWFLELHLDNSDESFF